MIRQTAQVIESQPKSSTTSPFTSIGARRTGSA